MSACTFFGHRDCPESIKPALSRSIENLIVSHGVSTFYVGNHGNFDRYVVSVLNELKSTHPNISYYVVLAYLPRKDYGIQSYETIFPDGIESVPKRFAINFRNRWMIDKSDYVITYVNRNFGGAAKAKEYAKKHAKAIINV